MVEQACPMVPLWPLQVMWMRACPVSLLDSPCLAESDPGAQLLPKATPLNLLGSCFGAKGTISGLDTVHAATKRVC